MKRPYDSTVARIAGNIAAGLVHVWTLELHNCLPNVEDGIVSQSVRMARAIVTAVERTEPKPEESK